MKTIIRAALDLAFGLAWFGVALLIVGIVARLASRLVAPDISEQFPFGSLEDVLVPILILWLALTAVVAIPCWMGVGVQEKFGVALWRRAFLLNVIGVGPTAFYIGALRPHLSGNAVPPPGQWSRPVRATVRVLHLLAFGGALAIIVLGIALLVIATSLTPVVSLGVTLLLLIPVTGLSTALLTVLLLVDAMQRSTEEDHGEVFLKMLNPWAWIFGLHLYYRRFLLPDMNRDAGK